MKKITRKRIVELILTRDKPRIPQEIADAIPSSVKTKTDLSDWLVDVVGFDGRGDEYCKVYRYLRDEFPVAISASEEPRPVNVEYRKNYYEMRKLLSK